ncbi:hypothetical protein RSSM_06316 [Rhodopirellula sallentina SM41]|uniref:Uncharacterized protein n=1 Tax=Rhodopirellula sallentina SM41 TaxID=1263870 RepID=M5TSQ1_9BACT|nr:hypothetical protein RSSM_06316 [Rhodopirellula sallentina SM41]
MMLQRVTYSKRSSSIRRGCLIDADQIYERRLFSAPRLAGGNPLIGGGGGH